MGGNKCPLFSSSPKWSGHETCEQHDDCMWRCRFDDGTEGCSLSAEGLAATIIATVEIAIELIREAIDDMFVI